MTRRQILVGLLATWNLLVFAAWIVLPFVLAATWRWYPGWSHLALILVATFAHQLHVRRKNPALREVRRRIGAGTARWDIAWNVIQWPLLASIAVVGGHDFGAHGCTLPFALSPVGAVVIGAGFALSGWAMGVNPHFEGTVRIQTERGHRVIDGGPYRTVRHPGYVGLALWACGTPLLLRSSQAILPAALYVAWVALRTGLEDAFLRKNLSGYEEFARRTRYRWIPGIW